MASQPRGKNLALMFFTEDTAWKGKLNCNVCGTSIAQKSGYSYLCNHLSALHFDLIAEKQEASTKRDGNVFNSMLFPTKAVAANSWLECAIHALQPFPFIENPV